jgi:hypothetical protein
MRAIDVLATLLLLGLAAQRAHHLWFTAEMFRPLRDGLARLGAWPRYLSGCPTCLTVWMAAFVVAAWHLGPWGQGVVWVLAISALLTPLTTVLGVLEGLPLYLASRPSVGGTEA